jgi:TP901 family phage tail tape measure protein
MAGNVKGITVEIGGDTTKLGKALESSEKQSRNLQKELKQVNTALKFNPGNVELLTQKQKLLTDQIQATKEKLDTLKEAEAQVTAQFKAGKIGEEQFREFQREIVETESKLKTYQSQLETTGKKASALEELTRKMSEQETALTQLKDEYKSAVLMYGKNSDEAKKLASEIDSLSTELKDNKTKMSDLDKAADELDNSLDQVDEGARKAGEGFTIMKGVIADLASNAIRSVVGKMTDLAKETLNVGMSFESSMSNNAALFKATGKELDQLSETAKYYGETTQFSASEAAEALGYMALAGWDAEKATKELGGVLDLAAASGMGLGEASDMVTDYLSAFSNSAMTATQFADKLAFAQANSNTTAQQLGEAYKNSAANLNAAGQDIDTVTSLLAAMANQGLKGSEAGTALSAMMRDLTAKMKDGKVMIGDTAVAVQDANGDYRDLTDILGDVEKATKGMGKAEKAAALSSTFTADSIKGLNLILNEGVDKTADFEEALRGADGSAADMAKTMNDNVAGSLKLLKSNIESKMIRVFDAAKGSIKGSVESMSAALDTLDWDKIGEGVGKFAEKIANLFNYVVENAETVKGVLMAIGTVITAVFAVNKVAGFIQSLLTLKGAFTALWGVMVANPVALVVAGFAALAAGMVALKKKSDEAIKSEYGLTDAQEKSISAAKRLKDEYDQLDKARKDALGAIGAEYGYLGELTDEYNSLIDSNGDVKEGYEDRANFILNQLAEALGVERDEILKNVEANGKLGKSIDELILKKQAEATLAATEDAYTKAIQNRNEALDTYMGAQKTYTEAEKKYQDSVKASGNVLDEYNRLLREAPSYADDYYWSNQEVIKGQQEAKTAYEEAKGALSEAESAYVGYNATIQNYEGLSSAIISGDTEKIRIALENSQTNFITAEVGTRDSLERQLQNLQENYRLMKEAVEQGMPGVSQAQVDAAKEMVEKAEAELNKLPPEAKKSGEQTGAAHAEGVKSTAGNNQKAGEKVAVDTDTGLGSQNTNATGKKKGDEYAAGVKSTAGTGNTSGKNVAQNTNKGLGTADTSGTGKRKGNEYASGVKSTSGTANAAGKSVGNSAKSGAGSVNTTSTGTTAGSQYVKGVKSKEGSAKSAGTSLGNNAKTGAGSVSAYSSGQNFGQGFINGIGSLFGAVWAKAKALAEQAWAGLRAGQKEGSPSKLTYQSGEFFDLGYINAIRDKTKDAIKAAKEMAKKTVAALNDEDDPDFNLGDPNFNGATFGRQLDNTFTSGSQAVDFSAILDRLDALETAIRKMRSVIVLDSGVLVGETINQIDSGLADVYDLKARGI